MSYFDIYVTNTSGSSNDFTNSRSNDVVFMPSFSNQRYCMGTTSNTISEFQIDKGLISVNGNMSMSSNLVVPYIVASNVVASNVNFTGSLLQNGVAYVGSQWTGTVGGPLSYGGGSVTVGFITADVPNVATSSSSSWTDTTNGIVYTFSTSSVKSLAGGGILYLRTTNIDGLYGYDGSGAYTGVTTQASGNTTRYSTVTTTATRYGEWFQIQSTVPFALAGYDIVLPTVGSTFVTWVVCGSTNNSTWYELDYKLNTNQTGGNYVKYAISGVTSATPQYTYFRYILMSAIGNYAGTLNAAYICQFLWHPYNGGTVVLSGGGITVAKSQYYSSYTPLATVGNAFGTNIYCPFDISNTYANYTGGSGMTSGNYWSSTTRWNPPVSGLWSIQFVANLDNTVYTYLAMMKNTADQTINLLNFAGVSGVNHSAQGYNDSINQINLLSVTYLSGGSVSGTELSLYATTYLATSEHIQIGTGTSYGGRTAQPSANCSCYLRAVLIQAMQ